MVDVVVHPTEMSGSSADEPTLAHGNPIELAGSGDLKYVD